MLLRAKQVLCRAHLEQALMHTMTGLHETGANESACKRLTPKEHNSLNLAAALQRFELYRELRSGLTL